MNTMLAAATLAAFATFMTHWQVGGIYASRPLLAARDITEGSRWLNYLCWHIVTVLLLLMTIALGMGAAGRISGDLLAFIAVMAAGISAVSVAVTLRGGINPFRFPSTYLGTTVAVLTVIGLRSGG